MPTPKNWDWPEEIKSNVALHENTILLYGIPKIGKTTFASKFSDALFFLTEEGAKHLSIRAWHIKGWADFLNRLSIIEDAIRVNQFPFKTIVIDTIDNLIEYCDQFICDRNSLNTLGDLEYGKAYRYYEKELRSQLQRITKLGLGLIFISHSEEKEVDVSAVTNPYAPLHANSETGKVRMVVPTLEKRAIKFVNGFVDMILYAEINTNNERVIRTKPTPHFEAGDRSGRLPASIALDYETVVKAYYGGENDQPPQELIDRLNRAEQYLAEKTIDGFEVSTRVINSRNKHLGCDKLEDAPIVKLESYLQHLRIKARNTKKEKKDEIPAD